MESTSVVARSNNSSSSSSSSPPKEAAAMVEPITEISDDTDPRNETFLTTVQEEDFEDDESQEEEPSIPLFHYSRIHGSLPRSSNTTSANGSLALSSRRTCSALGQIVLSSSSTSNRESDAAAVNQSSSNTANTALEHHETNTSITDLWKDHAIPIAAHGFANGQIWLVDAVTGVAVADPTQLTVRHNSRNQKAIVDLSIDATGTFLAALDEGGMCTIFEMQFTVRSTTVSTATVTAVDESEQPESPEPEQQQQQEQQQQHHNIFGFLSVLTGGKNQSNNDNHSSPRNSRNSSPQQSPQNAASSSPQSQPQQQQVVPTLKLASLQIHRISYPDSFGTPTCLALDPAYKRKRALAVGFADGRLILTKRGFVFQRRSDAVLYQGTDGIQALAWRHHLLAWADSSGVRLLDSETLQRIAHVDRPAGANPALYQHNLRLEAQPSLTFESNHRLLVAWGDCLLALKVTTQQQQQQQQQEQQQYKQRVECTMAWELDCIACGVSPLDAKHVLVVGVLPREDETEDDWIDSSSENDNHIVELQVIARSNGQVVFADELPLIQSPVDDTDGNNSSNRQVSTADYQLLSSFALSPVIETDGPFVIAPAKESTLKWSLDDVVVQDEQWLLQPSKESAWDKTNEDDNDDTDSVDSDDYAFVLRPLDGKNSTMMTTTTQASNKTADPPIMILACPGDAVLARTRNVDDAVSYALEQEKYALALHRALQHRQKLRRYDIADLVNEYLKALLRLNVTRVEKEHSSNSKMNRLSMRRMKLAAKALPRLLGGSREAWEHWIAELEKLPGAFFVVHDSLPVRDPKLGSDVYARVLLKMLEQVEEMVGSSSEDEASFKRVISEAEEQFLHTLVSWGTRHVLNEFVGIFEYQRNIDASYQKHLDEIVSYIDRREKQTAALYLNFEEREDAATLSRTNALAVTSMSDSQDALFALDELVKNVESRVLLDRPVSSPRESQSVTHINSRVCFDAMAKLSMMKGCIDDALKYYLVIGALHSSVEMQEVEEDALSRVMSLSGTSGAFSRPHDYAVRYAFVVYLIEKHHLHQYILDSSFLPETLNTSPLFALARLVGLDRLGEFLVSHCVAPQRQTKSKTMIVASEINEKERRGTLPLDLVAAQLETSPKLLHWYLNLIFHRKSELYVRFPNTSIPPPIVTDLHRKHLGLHIKYAGAFKDSCSALERVENYRVSDFSTPLLSFLKGVLPLGGIGAIEVGKMLEVERKGGAGLSRTFALELAYIMENYGSDTAEDSALILELYLKGVQSVMLAVSFAQRSTRHSSTLWQSLIEFCLSSNGATGVSSAKKEKGALFGSLLEAAALSGADLAHLVKQMPHGMAVQGLRPRLVAAVTDYRLKLQMHESASIIAIAEKTDIFREYSHRSRKGVRYEMPKKSQYPSLADSAQEKDNRPEGARANSENLRKSRRPRQRCDRYSVSLSIPIR